MRIPINKLICVIIFKRHNIMAKSILKTFLVSIKQKKFKNLIFMGLVFMIYHYGNFKYYIYKIINNKYKLVEVNGSRMYIHLDDNGISKELCLYKKREKFATEFMISFLDENDVIIEIGANIGYYVLLESRIAKKGKIFACEPAPFNQKLLKMNVQLNRIRNIEIYQLAISDQNQDKKFYIYENINWCSFNDKLDGNIISTEIVKTVTIDDFVKNHMNGYYPTFFRMDVEGHEYNVIKGALNTIRDCPKLKIFMEIHPHLLSYEQIDELISIFKKNKFRIKAIINESPPHINYFFDNKILNWIADSSYGNIGNNYEDLKKYLMLNKGTEIFLEKIQ